MKVVLIAMVSVFTIVAISSKVAKSDPVGAIQDVEIFMKKDAACK